MRKGRRKLEYVLARAPPKEFRCFRQILARAERCLVAMPNQMLPDVPVAAGGQRPSTSVGALDPLGDDVRVDVVLVFCDEEMLNGHRAFQLTQDDGPPPAPHFAGFGDGDVWPLGKPLRIAAQS